MSLEEVGGQGLCLGERLSVAQHSVAAVNSGHALASASCIAGITSVLHSNSQLWKQLNS